MDRLSVFLIALNIAIFVLTFLVMTTAIAFWRISAVRWLLGLSLAFCVVSFCTLNVYSSSEFDTKILFSRLRFLGLGFVPGFWLLFLVSTFQTQSRVASGMTRAWGAGMVLLPGAVSALFTLTSVSRDWILRDFTPIQSFGVSVVAFRGGVWFPFYYVWVLGLVLISLLYCGFAYSRAKSSSEKKQLSALVFGSVVAAGIDLYCVLTSSDLRWLMLSSGTFLFTLIGILYAVFRHGMLSLTPLAVDQLFRDLPDPVLVLDLEGRIRGVNSAAFKWLKLPRASIGRELKEYVPSTMLIPGECMIEDGQGRLHVFQVVTEPLIRPFMEASCGKLIYFRDITIQKMIERRLSENLEFKARLLALISHDLSGYLEGQALVSQSLNGTVSGDQLRERLELLNSTTMASQEFVSNVMSWVRAQGDSFEVFYRDFEWSRLLSDCLEDLQPQLCAKQIYVEQTGVNELIVAKGDSEMIRSVLRNLVSNAIRATPTGGRIEVTLKGDGESSAVSVRDYGAGMSESELERCMNQSEFLILRSPASNQNGFGIGLSLARHFIRLHRGTFEMKSRLGWGTQVTFKIPLEKPCDEFR